MERRKIIFVIVEGPSNSVALSSFLSEDFLGLNNVRFITVHGYITFDKCNDKPKDKRAYCSIEREVRTFYFFILAIFNFISYK